MAADDDRAKSKKRSVVGAPTTKSSKEKRSDKPKSKSKSDTPASSSKKPSKRSRDTTESAKKPSSRARKAATDTSNSAAKADELSHAAPATDALSPAARPQPLTLDADAVQLFRRYDGRRSGAISRHDFLQLLRDYAGPLTDASGTPLGFERSRANSEFEAGQLFERYDIDHAGTLSLDKFQRFFDDFRRQLVVFAQDVGYASARQQLAVSATQTLEATDPVEPARQPAALGSTPPVLPEVLDRVSAVETAQPPTLSTHLTPEPTAARMASANASGGSAAPVPEDPTKRENDTRKKLTGELQRALWRLRAILKDELLGQRERQLAKVRSGGAG